MIQRIVTAAVLSAGVAIFFSPSFAQTTMPGKAPQGGTMTTSPSGSTSSSGTMSGSQSGTMTTTQGGAGVSSSQSSTMGTTAAPSAAPMPRTAQAKAHRTVNQAQAPSRGADATERPITECLNNAAAQRQSFDSCRK